MMELKKVSWMPATFEWTNDGTGLEQGLGAAEPLIGDGDHLTIGETVFSVQLGVGRSYLHVLLKVEGQ